MKAATLAAIEALVLVGNYHIAHTILSAFSTSAGLCVPVVAGCDAEARGAGRERSHVIFVALQERSEALVVEKSKLWWCFVIKVVYIKAVPAQE